MHSDTLRFSELGTDMAFDTFVADASGHGHCHHHHHHHHSPRTCQDEPEIHSEKSIGVEPRPRDVHSSPSPLLLQPLTVSEGAGTGAGTIYEDSVPSPLQPLADSFRSGFVESCDVVPELVPLPRSSCSVESTIMLGAVDVDHEHMAFPLLDSIPEEMVDDDGTREMTTVNPPEPPSVNRFTSDISTTEYLWYSAEDTAWVPSAAPISTIEPTTASASTTQPPTALVSSLLTPSQPENEAQPELEPNELDTEDTGDTGDTSSAASTNGENSSVFDEDYHSDTSSYTASLLSDVKDYCYENGRRYHSYREGHYVLPNDDTEQDRQDLLHHVRNLVLNGALFRAPVGENMQRVLDIGTGTGIWAIDFADSYPSAEVVGTDLSPIQPSWVPPNLRFLVDDAESPWLFSASRPFDFIHARDLGGAIADWPRLLRQAHQHLRPGGWVELQEFEVTLKSDDESLRLAPTLREFLGQLDVASEAFHRPMNIAEGHRQRLVEAGFEDVCDEVYKVPSSAWHEDPVQKQIGRYNLCSLLMAVEAYSLALFTRVLGWSNNHVQVFLAGVRRDLRNPEVHTYCNLHIVYGRKPWYPQGTV